MKTILIIFAIVLTGCVSQTKYDFEPLPPEPLIKKNLVEKTYEVIPDGLEKGPFPPG